MITKITFEDILPIWRDHLWPNRISKIEANSAMVYLAGYDMENMKTNPTFFAFTINNDIAGVNSGHLCADNSYRSRGLFVFPKYRKLGIGGALLNAAIDEAITQKVDYIWSFPRKESWPTYERVGFKLSTEWEIGESGMNAYCRKDLK